MADADPVRLDVEGPVATITLDAPERKNSLAPELVGRLAQHLETAFADDSVRGQVTMSFVDVAWEDAFAAVLRAKGLGAVHSAGVINVTSLER